MGLDALSDPAARRRLAKQLPDRTETAVLAAAPDPLWEENWLRWMMMALCSLLGCEWLIRRLVKLA